VIEYLATTQQTVIDNVDDFRHTSEEAPEITFLGVPISRAGGARRCAVTR